MSKNKTKKKKEKRTPGLRITLLFTLIVMLEILATVWMAAPLSGFLGEKSDVHYSVWLCLISISVGFVFAYFVNGAILRPISRLSDAMSKVASGDFGIRLEAPKTIKIKEIKNTYESFNLMSAELSATEILQTDFVSNVSHEIKTPVNAIEGYAALLQNEDNTQQMQKEYIDKILFNTRRLSELVGNILLLSKLENSAIQTSCTHFRLDEQIRRSIMLLEPKWTEKETEFDVEMDSITVYANDGLLFHVWNNLIDNAIKFSPLGELITIRLTRSEQYAVFTIEDNGDGISEEAKKHIFDKFYQGDSSHKDNGNGLGLALVKKILSVANGEITVENLSPKGCRFTVNLPL